ncbi:MAG TPA: right-handed parallel beta-helix repeat-containing protein, partial [Polyangiaceae bacterium]|nr:right-handed parallel beta-helix repeat-containing protein [Polyangiaceae bacterium]
MALVQRSLLRVLGPFLVLSSAGAARAAEIEVGPSKEYQQLSDVADSLVPGDVVLVDGDASYGPVAFEVDGMSDAPITIRGVPINGKLPLIQGDARGVELAGDHYVFEGFEITGGTSSCLFHHAGDIVVRGVIVHDCPNHGILGADDDSGSLLLEYSEIYNNGEGTQHHQIYMATDENAYPGAVFRMQHCFVHDATGGNSVKSRAERNEIYYNWIEGAQYHELELIGPDEGSDTPPDPLAYREDSDVVGNVLRKAGASTSSFVARVGADELASDGLNATRGRYRFLNNTIILAADSSSVFRLFGLLESVEMHNNVVFRDGPDPIVLVRESDEEMAWISGRQVSGSNNWVSAGSDDVLGWSGTIFGADPGFTDLAAFDVMPLEDSPLRDAGNESPVAAAGFDFPNPLAAPVFLPP